MDENIVLNTKFESNLNERSGPTTTLSQNNIDKEQKIRQRRDLLKTKKEVADNQSNELKSTEKSRSDHIITVLLIVKTSNTIKVCQDSCAVRHPHSFSQTFNESRSFIRRQTLRIVVLHKRNETFFDNFGFFQVIIKLDSIYEHIN